MSLQIRIANYLFQAPEKTRELYNAYYRKIYTDFCFYLKDEYENENTRHFYEYGMYEKGAAVIMKNNAPKYIVIEFSKIQESAESADKAAVSLAKNLINNKK